MTEPQGPTLTPAAIELHDHSFGHGSYKPGDNCPMVQALAAIEAEARAAAPRPTTEAGRAMYRSEVWDRMKAYPMERLWIGRSILAIEAEARAAAPPDTHTHIAQYPSACTGCEHLAADLANRLPPGLWPSEARRRLDEAEARAAAPPDIDVERLVAAEKELRQVIRQAYPDSVVWFDHPGDHIRRLLETYRRLASTDADATRRDPQDG